MREQLLWAAGKYRSANLRGEAFIEGSDPEAHSFAGKPLAFLLILDLQHMRTHYLHPRTECFSTNYLIGLFPASLHMELSYSIGASTDIFR